ncbi:MAG: hypothetical protein Q7U04_17600 [Bacteriovorax sp.]|nr:hypothetical protein [Bacteriovorax sp.]
MCEVCRAQGEDYLFKNGPKKILTNNNLYKVFKDAVAPVKLCHVHSIELFHMGERRFLREHIDFTRVLAAKSRTQTTTADSPFGI